MDERLITALNAVQQFLKQLAPIPDDELSRFVAESVTVGEYPTGTFFTRVGDRHDRVGFVVRGLFRVYYSGPSGAYYVRNFCREGTPIGAFATILESRPANASIEAIEDSLVFEFSHRAMAEKFETSVAWERLGRRLAEQHYISRERREHAFLTLRAPERFDRFHEDFPGLAGRLSGKDIASYIAVRPETLSRMRAQRARASRRGQENSSSPPLLAVSHST